MICIATCSDRIVLHHLSHRLNHRERMSFSPATTSSKKWIGQKKQGRILFVVSWYMWNKLLQYCSSKGWDFQRRLRGSGAQVSASTLLRHTDFWYCKWEQEGRAGPASIGSSSGTQRRNVMYEKTVFETVLRKLRIFDIPHVKCGRTFF